MRFPVWFQKAFYAIALKINPEAKKVRKSVLAMWLNVLL
jgi:hypothetical protein